MGKIKMTTLAAVKKGKRLCIASDSLARFGSRKEITEKHVYGNEKIVKIGPNFIGFSGHPSWKLILDHYFSKKKNISPWKTADQIFKIFNAFHYHLKQNYFLKFSSSVYVPVEISELEFLIISPCGIFEVDYARVIRHHLHFSAMGTGEDYALGAIRAVFDLIKDPEEIARIGIEAAAQFDRKTDLPIQIQCINLE